MSQVIPIIRIFDYNKAIEFYIGWLGFHVDWDNRHHKNIPVFMQLSLRDIVLHLSEHHGDGSPGVRFTIRGFDGLREYHQLLIDKNYTYNRPSLDVSYWNPKEIEMTAIDPFGNRLHFTEAVL